MIAGIHVDGPFINGTPGYVGAHSVADVMQADFAIADRLIDAGRGKVRLLTLAPEQDRDGRVTRHLSDRGVIVAAGHTDASLDQLKCGIDPGLSLFTHLGNGCRATMPRHNNIVQRVLSLSDKLYISLIADGYHVPDFAIRNYLRRIPDERVIIVTDAISAAGLGPGRYSLGGQYVDVGSDGAAWSANRTHFAGCATTMRSMVQILRSRVVATANQIDQWTRVNPQRLVQFVR